MRSVFSEYGTPLTAVTSLKYLEKIISSTDNKWPEVDWNMQQARQKWGRMVNILGRDGAYKRMPRKFYVAVVQAVLLFGSEMWVVTPRMEKALLGFHHREVRRMAGMVHGRQLNRAWVYPPIGAVLETVLLEDIKVYIYRHQNMVAQYIVTCTIMDLCLAAYWRLGMRILHRWWEQPSIYILGIRVEYAENDMGEDTGTDDLEVERDQDTEGRKEGGRLDELDKIRCRLGA